MGHGFEGFALADSRCPGKSVWLEYGGRIGSGTIFAGAPSSARARDQNLVIEGISTSMVYDYEFRKLDSLIRRPNHSVQAPVTLVGRFFSGDPFENTSDYGGYGHLGMFSLFMIQRVVAVGGD